MILFPNAKINLGLDILHRRPDGYHDIETVMVPVPWRDVLEIVPSAGSETTLTVSGRHVDCPAEKNLVMKAYRALSETVGLPPSTSICGKSSPTGPDSAEVRPMPPLHSADSTRFSASAFLTTNWPTQPRVSEPTVPSSSTTAPCSARASAPSSHRSTSLLKI